MVQAWLCHRHEHLVKIMYCTSSFVPGLVHRFFDSCDLKVIQDHQLGACCRGWIRLLYLLRWIYCCLIEVLYLLIVCIHYFASFHQLPWILRLFFSSFCPDSRRCIIHSSSQNGENSIDCFPLKHFRQIHRIEKHLAVQHSLPFLLFHIFGL